MQKSKIIVAVLLVIAVIGAVIVMNIGSLAKGVIEKIASNTMQTKVTISSLDISIADKSVSVNGITIANPKGFSNDYLLKVKTISVKAEDLTGDVIILKEILVDGLDIQYELMAKGSNIGALKKNLKSSNGNESDKDTSGDAGKPMVISVLKMLNAKVTPSIRIGNVGTKAPLNIADITLHNIGSNAKPMKPAKVIVKVMNSLLPMISKSVTKAGLGEELLKNVGGDFKSRKDQANKALKGLFGK